MLVVSLESEVSKQSSVRYWLEHLRSSSPRSTVVVVGTHSDVLESKVAAAQEKKLRDLMAFYPQLKGVIVATATSQSKKGAFSAVEAKIVSVLRGGQSALSSDSVSQNMHELTEALAVQREVRSCPMMTQEEVAKMAEQHGVEHPEKVARQLHDMGFLWLSGEHAAVLDVAWLSSALGTLVSAMSRSKKNKKDLFLFFFLKSLLSIQSGGQGR